MIMEIRMTPIGQIALGCDGSDQYVLVERIDGFQLSGRKAIDWLLSQVYRETRQEAGGYFCTSVRAARVQYSRTSWICTIQHRYDI